jgi:hypothetical protein
MKSTLETIRASDIVARRPPSRASLGPYAALADYITGLRPDWHPDYVCQVADRYKRAGVPIELARRSVAAGHTSSEQDRRLRRRWPIPIADRNGSAAPFLSPPSTRPGMPARRPGPAQAARS